MSQHPPHRPPGGTARLVDVTLTRIAPFRPVRRRWPGLLAVGVVLAAMAAMAVSSLHGEQVLTYWLDATGGSAEHRPEASAATASSRTTDDASVTAAAKGALSADPSLAALAIDVAAHDGVVVLRGAAPDADTRARAGLVVAAAAGVKGVDNRLRVGGGPTS